MRGRSVPRPSAHSWSFLEPYVAQADAYVFSRSRFVWKTLEAARSFTIPPVINPLAPKNQELSKSEVAGILAVAGVQPDGDGSGFVRLDGTPGRVDRAVTLEGGAKLPADVPVILQASDWNSLKDPAGVVRMFAEFVAPQSRAHLIVAGPGVEWISEETEAEATYEETLRTLHELPPAVRERVHVISIPNDDPEEAGALVNALQRRASVAVQRSRGEGFGMAVMEAMWKRLPVVSSRVGGLQEQVIDRKTGFLIDPGDVRAAGEAILKLLDDADRAAEMGEAGHDRVKQHFLLPHDVPRWLEAIEYALMRQSSQHERR